MKIQSALARLVIVLSVTLFLTGCGGNWLVGKWALDQERTLEAISAEKAEPGEGKGLLKDIVNGLQKGVSRIMLAQFDGVLLEFTPEELRTTRNGVGDAQAYEIIEKPGSGTYVLKFASGKIETWKKFEDRIAVKLTGDREHWVYFAPVE